MLGSLGDVRTAERISTAMRNVDFVIHAAAMKIVTTAEYNPFECIQTNVIGAENIVQAAIEMGGNGSLHCQRIRHVIRSIFMVLQSLLQTKYLLLETTLLARGVHAFL